MRYLKELSTRTVGLLASEAFHSVLMLMMFAMLIFVAVQQHQHEIALYTLNRDVGLQHGESLKHLQARVDQLDGVLDKVCLQYKLQCPTSQ
jgi:hypothetical protein